MERRSLDPFRKAQDTLFILAWGSANWQRILDRRLIQYLGILSNQKSTSTYGTGIYTGPQYNTGTNKGEQ